MHLDSGDFKRWLVDSKATNESGAQLACPACGSEFDTHVSVCPHDSTPLKAITTDPFVGTLLIGKYEVLSSIGKGGMSVVYKARNRLINSTVAIKTLKADFVSDQELFARFSQEAAALKRLTHPNIVTVHEFGVSANGQPFLVMDYLEGEPLSEAIERLGRIPVKRCLKIFIQVCDALAHAHSHKIIHRDVKPGNIMLVETATEVDMVKIFDFGFAKLEPRAGMQQQQLTQKGDVLGTPLYMSPEQSRGKNLDSRSDIYSLGCVMYEALTGKAPLVGDNVLDTMQKQINERPESLDTARPDLYIPEQLTTVLFKTLEKEAEKRYQSMTDLKRDLEVINIGLTGKGSVAPSGLPGLSKLKQLPEKRSLPELSALMLLAMLVGALLVFWVFGGFNNKNSQTIGTGSTDHAASWVRYRQSGLNALDKKHYTEALDFWELALKEAWKADDSERKAATSLDDIARLYLAQEKYSDAEKACRRSLALRQKQHGGDERLRSTSLRTLADIYIAREDWRDAEGNLQKALEIQQRELGTQHEDVGETLNCLATVAEKQQNYSRAESLYKQALSIRQTALGPNKLPVAETLEGYARLLNKMNRKAEAHKLDLRARAIRALAPKKD